MADGDAGNAFLQTALQSAQGGGDPANPFGSAEQVNAFAGGAKNLLGQAKSGGWAINEEGGSHFLGAVKEAQKQLLEVAPRLDSLKRAPMLGNDDYARVVAEQVRAAMDSDDQSLVPVFNKFYEGLDLVREAIEIAKKNYRAADAAAVKRLGEFKD
jgi:hypothetical protein